VSHLLKGCQITISLGVKRFSLCPNTLRIGKLTTAGTKKNFVLIREPTGIAGSLGGRFVSQYRNTPAINWSSKIPQ